MCQVIDYQIRDECTDDGPKQNETLDPRDWQAFREQAHRMLDNILDYTKNIRQRPVWQPIPHDVRGRFRSSLPVAPSPLAEVHQEFMNCILPYAAGNVHPGFMGWVHGGGTPIGMLAEMLAGGLNANLAGRDQIPVEVERQVIQWTKEIFGFPDAATGLFVTGTSIANFIAVVVARDAALGWEIRRCGLAATAKRLKAYASAAVHGCVAKAMDLSGMGSDALRLVPTDNRGRIELSALKKAIFEDREAGCVPFLIVGTAGSVGTGAIDDLVGLAELAHQEKLWFHVDGAYGALAMLAQELAPKLRGIERADSLAFDFHKWGQVPYDAGFVLVRDGRLQQKAFAVSSAYLQPASRGLAGGSPWPCDYGPDLSRGFRALKVWFTLKVYGTKAIGAAISRTCNLACYLEQRIVHAAELELLAPVELNIVCFRYRAEDSDRVNAQIVVDLQESGSVAPSTVTVDGRLAIRAAIVNHRTGRREIDALVERTLALGRGLSHGGEANVAAVSKTVSAESSPRSRWFSELHDVESQLESDPDSIDLRLRRASLLADLGQFAAASVQYLKVLELQPCHCAALNKLGDVLIATSHRQAARTAYGRAAFCYPDDPVSRGNYGYFLLEESERLEVEGRREEASQLKREAREHFEHALRVSPADEKAHEGLYYLLRNSSDSARAAWHRNEAFRNRAIIPSPYRGDGTPIPILQLLSTTGGNVRLQRFLDSRVFQTFFVLPEFCDSHTPLPAHELVINGIGDAEAAPEALAAAQSIVGRTTAPVINSPTAVLATTRSNNAKRFAGLQGVVTPLTIELRKEQLADSNAESRLNGLGFAFPLLLRAPGFHTGQNFLRVDTCDALRGALAQLSTSRVIVMQYVDLRGADEKIRKYRVMMIDGQLYPLHVAISSHWKIHYMTAEMAGNDEHRAEDATFLENMPDVLGGPAVCALERIQTMLGLDYAGIDFGLNVDRKVVVFEANATMVVNQPEPDARWNYRRPACKRVAAAVHNMLQRRLACAGIAVHF